MTNPIALYINIKFYTISKPLPCSVIAAVPNIADRGGRCFAAHLILINISVRILGALPFCPTTIIIPKERLRLQNSPGRDVVNRVRGNNFVAKVANDAGLQRKLAVL